MIPLCIVSRAEPGECESGSLEPTDPCPLGLSKREAAECRCRSRRDVGRRVHDGCEPSAGARNLVVVVCLHPYDWRGRRVD